jgi:hypothetical protein
MIPRDRLVAVLASVTGALACGMPKFGGQAGEANREICQRYVDGAAPFIGQQQGLGVTFAVAAVLAFGLGAAISNAASGSFWSKNSKALLLTSAAACSILCYNFLDNAKSAADSAAQASVALASTKDEEMWAGCQHARAVYFDGRAAGIAATRDAVTREAAPTGSARTPPPNAHPTSPDSAEPATPPAPSASAGSANSPAH